MVTAADFESKTEIKWCPGCGNFGILAAMKDALAKLGLSPEKVLVISGIGQAAKTPEFMQCNMFHALHGRALPLATAAKIANHNLKILVNTGDGDCYGEGGNHFMHAVRRNIDLTVLAHNNMVYGLTKGQASPTSERGTITRVHQHGVIMEPFNPLAVALSLKAGFVARGFSGRMEHLSSIIQQALQYNGFSLIDVLQPCVSFNHVNTHRWYSERVYELEKENYSPADYMQAMVKAQEWGNRIPIGIVYKQDKPSFTDQVFALKDGPLVDRTYSPEPLRELLKEL
ncbi:MAG: 2-oxoacid:ferredoxin oxidoreductase subunit beta [Proteobacteria bacterium]|nr:2-oxoacid:ferredoxin oxidoreductase subunit beta [Pseudomonadota bacterium]